MTIDEIKFMRIANQYLVEPADTVTVIRDLCGFQAQFLSNALHSMKIRCNGDLEDAVKHLVKNWTVRGTVHVFAESDLPLFKYKKQSQPYLSDIWHGYVDHFTRDWTLTPERQQYFSHIIINSLKDTALTREELKVLCRDHGMTQSEEASMFDQWGGGMRELCERGFLCYTVQEQKTFRLCPPFEPMDEREAFIEMAKRYFTNFGPATLRDAAYYFGTSQSNVKSWSSTLPLKSFKCEGKIYFYIENGKSFHSEFPACIFLAGFDQLMLGYQKKDSLFLSQEYLRGIFNLAGIVMPAVLLRGQTVGKWSCKNGKLTVTLFTDISEKDKRLIANQAERLWKIQKIVWMA